MATSVRDNESESRFEIHLDGVLAGFVDYTETDGVVSLTHTLTYPQFRGQGLATELIVAALGVLFARGAQILPLCPFIPNVIRDHPEFIELVPVPERAQFGLAGVGAQS